MRSISYQLRGTSGTGKTTVARHLMQLAGAVPVDLPSDLKFWAQELGQSVNKPLLYEGDLFGVPFKIIGCYRNTNGGCDTIRKVGITAALVEHFLGVHDAEGKGGVVFFEGLMISHMLGTVGEMQFRTGQDRNILAFLDTPLEVCLERVKQRRLEAGNTKPFNPTNTTNDHPRVHSSKRKAIAGGFCVTEVDHTRAKEVVVQQIEEALRGVPITGRLGLLD